MLPTREKNCITDTGWLKFGIMMWKTTRWLPEVIKLLLTAELICQKSPSGLKLLISTRKMANTIWCVLKEELAAGTAKWSLLVTIPVARINRHPATQFWHNVIFPKIDQIKSIGLVMPISLKAPMANTMVYFWPFAPTKRTGWTPAARPLFYLLIGRVNFRYSKTVWFPWSPSWKCLKAWKIKPDKTGTFLMATLPSPRILHLKNLITAGLVWEGLAKSSFQQQKKVCRFSLSKWTLRK